MPDRKASLPIVAVAMTAGIPAPQPTDGPPTGHVGHPTILVVDSDTDARNQTSLAFELHGCTAVPADSIWEALTFLSQPWMGITVVLCAIDLSDGPSETVAIVVRNTARLSGVRVVIHGDGMVDTGHDAVTHAGQPGDEARASRTARADALLSHGVGGFVGRSAMWPAVWGACFPG